MHALMENPIIIQLFVFLVVIACFMACGFWKPNRALLIETRVRRLGSHAPRSTHDSPRAFASLTSRIPQVTESMLVSDANQRLLLRKRLLEAGIYQPWALPVYVTIRFVFMIVPPIICFAVMQVHGTSLPWGLLVASLLAVLGLALPPLWLKRLRAQRHLALRRAIPDFLDLIVACLGGGLSVQASLRQVADELQLAHPDLSGELNMVLREIELGGTLDHALQQLAVRTGLEELRTLRSFIHQTTKFGTTITDALGQLADMLRVQREQRAEELAQQAAVKILFPTVLFILPTLFVILAGPAAMQIQKGFTSPPHQRSSSNAQP